MSTQPDPVTFEVVWHRLLDLAEEMGIKYMRTSGSPILVGGYDASTGITLADGQLVAIGPYITTQAHVLPLIIRSVQDRCAQNPGIGPGDVFTCNDPYLGATHQPDVASVAPVFADGQVVAWVGASGHWLDIGGSEPGSFNMNARSVLDEGLRMPPLRIVEGGTVRSDLLALIMNQVRDPLSELDMRGQIVATRVGVEGLRLLFEEHGTDVVLAVMKESIAHVERRLRQRLRSLPDGEWREVQYIDHDGHAPTLREIVCTVRKTGEHLSIDFTGTSPSADGFANCTLGGLRAAVMSGVSIVLGYDLPWNEGISRCVDLIAPPGTSVTAEYPTPVSAATITLIILSLNATFGALTKMLACSTSHHDEAMGNWCGTSLAPTQVGLNEHGFMTVNGETSHFAAGCGARSYADGVDTGGIIINTTASIPSIEAVESEYPLLYLFRRQLTDSGGAGKYRGGASAGVAIIPYHPGGPIEASLAGAGAEAPNAYGLSGGLPGAAARYIRIFGSQASAQLTRGQATASTLEEIGGDAQITPINHSHADFPADMVDYHNWQGGGGYGDPLERDPAAVADDVRAQLVSEGEARRLYGVVMVDGDVDRSATLDRRAEIRRERLALSSDEPQTQASGPRDTEGATTYGDSVVFDFVAGTASCKACGLRLGAATADFRKGCLVEESPTSGAGPVRGTDYRSDRIRLRRYYCPGCARQLEAEVIMVGGTERVFRLAGPAEAVG